MLIQPVEVTELPTSAVIKITAVCGETKQLSIAGVSIEFSCEGHPEVSPEAFHEVLPAVSPEEPAGVFAEKIPSPRAQDPGRVAFAIQDLPSLFERLPSESEIDTHAAPVVFTVPGDRGVSLGDLSGHLSVAHQEHRAIRFDIGSQRQ